MDEKRAVARSTDPSTSWEAARSVQNITEHQGEVLAAYRGRKDMADEDLVLNLQRSGSRQSPSGIRTRRAELVALGLLADTGDRVVGSTGRRMILWGLPREIVPNPVSPLRGSPRDTSDPNIKRVTREGKPDQYLNVRRAQSMAANQSRIAAEEERVRVQKATPRVDPSTHRLTFGGPVLCKDCGGTGGSLWEACIRCGGGGLT